MTTPHTLASRRPLQLNNGAEIALLDELAITAASWSSLKVNDASLYAYAEKIPWATAAEIREGFRLARAAAKDWPPKPGDLRKAIDEQARLRRERERPRGTTDEAPPLGDDAMRMHRAVVRLGFLGYLPIEARNGQRLPQAACPDASKAGYAELWRRYEAGHLDSVVGAVAILEMYGADPAPFLELAQRPLRFDVPPVPPTPSEGV